MGETNVLTLTPEKGTSGQSRIRIAIADDHPIFRDGLCRLLALEDDFDVVAQAEDGSEVSDVVKQYQPDILLLDLNMPRLGGLATLQQLQAAHGKMRVIVLTASDDKNDLVQALKLGSAGIVLKQTATEQLIDSIRQVHAGEFSLDSRSTAALIQGFVSPAATQQPASIPAPWDRERQPLSPREREIVSLVSQGFKNTDIAARLQISEQTVKNHLHNIFDKLGVTDRLELALYAVQSRLHSTTPAALRG